MQKNSVLWNNPFLYTVKIYHLNWFKKKSELASSQTESTGRTTKLSMPG